MLIVDASALFELVADTPAAGPIRARVQAEGDLAAPHIVDPEVFGVIRKQRLIGTLDETAGRLAVEALRDWPGERFGHQALLGRMWELRATVRGWDAAYVALAEVLEATLLTTDARLARASGPRCPIEVVAAR